MGDTDPSNDIISQVPAIDQLLDLKHPEDGVSAIFDRKITVNNSYSSFSEDVKTEIVAENFLTTQKEISIPGSYNEGSGIANYMTNEHITLDVIEVIPTDGVYYDNSEGYNPEKLKGLGYSYYFFDEDNDGQATMVFVVDSKGEVKAVGFDYDGNAVFNPRETLLTERHIISNNIVQAGISQMLKHFIKNDLLTFGDDDTYEGVFSVPTFRDPLFDIWKSQYGNGTSILMREVKKMTSDRFIQSLSVAKISIDILTQVSTQYSAFLVGTSAGMGLGTVLPVVGNVIGFLGGYFVTYVYLNTIVAWAKQKDLDSYIKSQTAHNPYYEGEKILSTVSEYDYYDSVMTNVLQGSPRGKYAEVKVETGKYEFKGQVILAPKGEDKTSNYGKTFTDIDLDYSQQTRSYLMYSDFGPRLDPFLTTTVMEWKHVPKLGLIEVEKEVPNPEFYYMENSIMYLENAIHLETSASAEEETRHYDRIIPYMSVHDVSIPSLQFASSDGPFYLPEFYLDYPIFVSSENYEDVKNEFHKIYKVYDGTSNSVQLLPDEYAETRKLMSDIISVNAYYLDSLNNRLLIEIYTKEDYEFNPTTGKLSFSDTHVETLNNFIETKKQTYNDIINYDGWIILEVHIEKFRNISSTEQYQVEIAPEIANKIATAQSSHASILEYLYQYTIAEDTQQKLDQISYTVWLTIASTLITIGLAAGTSKLISAALPVSTGTVLPSSSKVVNFLNKIVSSKSYQITKVGLAVFSESMEEVYVDPWIEAFVTKAVRDAGGDGFEQILWSSMAESGRESLVSGVTSILGSYSTSSQIRAQLQTEQALAGTSQDSRTTFNDEERKLFAERQQQEDQLRSERIELITTSISSILMFAGALSGGIFGSSGASLGNLLILSSVGVDLSKDVFELALKTKQENVGTLDIHSRVSDAWKSRIVREVQEDDKTGILTAEDKNNAMTEFYEHASPLMMQLVFPELGLMQLHPDLGQNNEIQKRQEDLSDEEIDFLIELSSESLPFGVDINNFISYFESFLSHPYNRFYKNFQDLDYSTSESFLTQQELHNKFARNEHYGIIYKITLVQDRDGNPIISGPSKIGSTIRSGEIRYDEDIKDAKAGRSGNFFDALRNNVLDSTHTTVVNKDAFKVEIVDIVEFLPGMINSKLSASLDLLISKEEFWTIFYNADPSSSEGYDLKKNYEYNQIVGQIGRASRGVKKVNIPKENLLQLITLGYEVKALAKHFKTTTATINNRIKEYWKIEGFTKTEDVREHYIGPLLISLIKLGFTVDYIAKTYFKKDFSTRYTRSAISYWIKKYTGFVYHDLRRHIYSIPTIISGIKEGKSETQIAQDLGLTTEAVQDLLRVEWGQEFSETGDKYLFYKIRDKYLKPLIQRFLTEGLSIREIGRRLDRSAHFVTDFIRDNFGMTNTEAKLYFQSHYLSHHW